MKTQTIKTAAVIDMLSRGTSSAPTPAGGSLPAAQERTIKQITAEILKAKRVGGEAILTIGKGLIEAKSMLSHGEWLSWLSEKVEFSERTAQNFMRLAREWSNPQALADLGASKALVLLALPESEREAFMSEPHKAGSGEKTVFDMTERELKKALREREEALAEKSAAEEARAKMEADVKLTKELLAGAQEDRDAALREAEKQQSALLELEQAADRLTRELEELKARPVEVAVAEADPAQLERARAEGEAAKAAELDALQKKLDKAEKARKDAEDKLAAAKEKLDAPAEPATPSPLAADAELAQFKLLFEQAQAIANQMRGLLLKVRGRENKAEAGKLEQALCALGEKIRGWAQ